MTRPPVSLPPGSRVAVTGASGFIGSALMPALRREGYAPVPVVRRQARAGEIAWDPAAGTIEGEKLADIGAVVHLAGENLATRWTREAKRRIRESRVRGTALLAATLAGLDSGPSILVSTSAVGFYGDRGEETLTDTSPPGTGFLAEVVEAWEEAARPAGEAGIRVVHPRFGMVLHPDGGALGKMLLPFRLGVGGRLGSGRQWVSWIARDDLVAAILFLLREPIAGPVNCTAPEPVRNADFTRALALELHRPAVLPVPRLALAALFGGEMVDETLLVSARVLPARLIEQGFTFRFPRIREALAHLLSPAA